jgi:hypothetical protein
VEPLGERSAAALAALLLAVPSLRGVCVRGRGITVADAHMLLQALEDSDPLRCTELVDACNAVLPDTDDDTDDLIQSVLVKAQDGEESGGIASG